MIPASRHWLRGSRPVLGLLLVLFLLASQPDTAADAAHRPMWKVYPVIFYGSDENLDAGWGFNVDRQMEQIRAYYRKELSGSTFEIGTRIVMQGQQPWRFYYQDLIGLIPPEMNNRGEHVWSEGYIYLVFFPHSGYARGGYGCIQPNGVSHCGAGFLGQFALEADERPYDCKVTAAGVNAGIVKVIRKGISESKPPADPF